MVELIESKTEVLVHEDYGTEETPIIAQCSVTKPVLNRIVFMSRSKNIIIMTEQGYDFFLAESARLTQIVKDYQKELEAEPKNENLINLAKERLTQELTKEGIVGAADGEHKVVELLDLFAGNYLYVSEDALAELRLMTYAEPLQPGQEKATIRKAAEFVEWNSLDDVKTTVEKKEVEAPDTVAYSTKNPVDHSAHPLPFCISVDPGDVQIAIGKAFKAIQNIRGSIQCEIKVNAQISLKDLVIADPILKLMAGHVDDWLKVVQESLTGKWEGSHPTLGDIVVEPTVEILRFIAGASCSAGFSLAEAKVWVKGEANIGISLLDAKIPIKFHLPSKEGFHIKLPNVPRKDQAVQYQLASKVEVPPVVFEFDQSFLRPNVMEPLRKLDYELHQGDQLYKRKVQLVGHTDLVGEVDYNSHLSIRRARAVYGFITNNPDIWEQLHQYEGWTLKVYKTILVDLGYYQGDITSAKNTSDLIRAVQKFQAKYRLKRDGIIGYNTRRFLFIAYMLGPRDCKVMPQQFCETYMIGQGEAKPAVDTQERLEANRRVEFHVYEPKPYPEIDLGHILLVLSVELYGYAGANAAVGIDLEASANGLGELMLRGLERQPEPEIDLTPNAPNVPEAGIEYNESTFNELEVTHDVKDKVTTNILKDGTITGTQTEKEFIGHRSQTDSELIFNDGEGGQLTIEETIKTTTGLSDDRSTSTTYDIDSGTLSRQHSRDVNAGQTRTYSASATAQKVDEQGNPQGTSHFGVTNDMHASAFAGARAGAAGSGVLLWKSPEKPDEEFVELASMAGGVDARAGIGAEVKFTVVFQSNKIKVAIAASLTFGFGAKGHFMYSINPWNIADFAVFVYTKLRDNDFNFIGFIDEYAFEILAKTMFYVFVNQPILHALWSTEFGKEIYDFLEGGTRSLVELWKERSAAIAKADTLIDNLNTDHELIKYCAPETRGWMLDILCDGTSYRSFDEDKEEAGICVLRWVQSFRDYIQVLKNMHPEYQEYKHKRTYVTEHACLAPHAVTDSIKLTWIKESRNRLHALFDWGEQTDFDQWGYEQLLTKCLTYDQPMAQIRHVISLFDQAEVLGKRVEPTM